MTAEQMIQAKLVIFAYEEAGWTGSLQCMLAVACVLKNRVDAGWGEWMSVLEDTARVAGNGPRTREIDGSLSAWYEPTTEEVPPPKMDLADENLRDLMGEVDDIYHGIFVDELTKQENPMGGEATCLYYCFVERPIRDWFAKHIIQSPEHPRVAQVGQMMLYE
jgi:hypothetical protein